MSSLNENEVGAVSAATDLEDAKASGPANRDNASILEEQAQAETFAIEEEAAGEQEGPIDGAKLLDDCVDFIKRFTILPSEAASVAMAGWAAHAHLMEAWETTPRLAFLSAEPSSGKTRAMDIVALLCPLALETSNASAPALMRATEDPEGTPTFFIDEIDTVYGKNGKGDENLRGMINAGHRRGKGFLRCGTDKEGFVPRRWEVFAAVAMAGIGNLPDTILTRSIKIMMRMRARHERVEDYRPRDVDPFGHSLRDRLAEWAKQNVEAAKAMRPDLPEEVCDRKADVWEPIIVVGDLAGGDWPERTRNAALEFIQQGKSAEGMSLGVQLLRDLDVCFGDEPRVDTAALLGRLADIETAPWADLSGKPLDAIRLASLLKPYGIEPGTIRLGTETPKGYKRADFIDAWNRYLP